MTNHLIDEVEGLIAAALMVVSSPKEELGTNPEAQISSAEIARDRMVAEYLGQRDARRRQDNFELACQKGDVLSVHLAITDFQKEVNQMERSRRSEGFTAQEKARLAALKQQITSGEDIIRGFFPVSLAEAAKTIEDAFGMVCNRSA